MGALIGLGGRRRSAPGHPRVHRAPQGRPVGFSAASSALALGEEVAQVADGGVGPGNMGRHDQTMIGKEAEAAAVRGDWRQERLPPELHARLVQAVENNSITQVRRAFDDMGELEEGRANLVAELRALAGRYDMPALRSVLDAVAPD